MSTDPKPVSARLRTGAPEMHAAFAAFNQAVLGSDTALDRRTKELIAVAVALTTQCPGCLDAHSAAAAEAGATHEELAEVVHVAAALRAGGAIYHGAAHTMRAVRESEH
ncbi:carboxymuconolactone decarboxylase family protein [Microbacterium halotolerans]|uniref:carboxymuconolactone decarboxylase family protein n=1 Tax=Microbacterium halotolerans TaxID=246613 RepID=UPI000E6AD516|nr:carboxymuconolactone decarboxylase family protein [Microbacterium halotolerans]